MPSPLEISEAIQKAKEAVKDLEEPFKIPAFTTILSKELENGHGSYERPRIEKETAKPHTLPKTKSESSTTAKQGPSSWIRELVDEGFFAEPKKSKDITDALNERGHLLSAHDITAPLVRLVNQKLLRRKMMKSSEEEDQQVHWVNW